MGFVSRTITMISGRMVLAIAVVWGMHLSSFGQSEQPVLSKIHITGNHFFSTPGILDRMTSKNGMHYSSEQISADINRLYTDYAENGFYFAEVKVDSIVISKDGMFGDLWLNIREGDRMVIDSIGIAGNQAIPESVLGNIMQTQTGKYLQPQILEQDINNIIREYEQHGYPFASVHVRDIVPEMKNGKMGLHLIISIDEGKLVTIDEVKLTGNTFTKSDVIIREMRLTEHELYDEQKMSRISGRLKRMNIFSRVDSPEPFVTDSTSGILVNVREGTTSTFDGILGYSPGAGVNDHSIVTGMVTVSMRNLFGTARKANIHWMRDERKSQEILIGYTEPWMFGIPLDLGIQFAQRQQDSTYVQRKFGVTSDLWLGESFTCGATFRQEYVIPSSGLQTLLSSRTTVAGVTLRYDSRDDILSPMSGVYYYTDYQIGRKIRAGQASTVQRASFDAAYYVQPFRRQVAAIAVHGRGLYGGNTDLSDLYRFGGTNTLRGYRENQFLGSRIVWTNVEYRFILAPRSFVYGFFDAGYYYRGSTDVVEMPGVSVLKYGYGIGFRIETAIGNIGVGFGFGEGDTFTQGKVHVGLFNEF